jgi:uncharacterized protein with gpF-like domain
MPKLSEGGKALGPIHPSAGLEVAYRRKLLKLVDEMGASIAWFVPATYRANEPAIAQDIDPADALRKKMADLSKRWLKRFDQSADDLAEWFAQAASDRSDAALKAVLRKGGFSVKFKPSPAQRDTMKATVQANVSLIKSIPQQYLASVEGAVMRSVQTGRDLGSLTKELVEHHGVTQRRAALIARSQNSMATSALTRARQVELGITQAIWQHSGGGREVRPSHAKAGRDKQRYDVAKGWYDPDVGDYIHPGQLLNCRCVSRPVIPGLSQRD